LVEHSTFNRMVEGSSPSRLTTIFRQSEFSKATRIFCEGPWRVPSNGVCEDHSFPPRPAIANAACEDPLTGSRPWAERCASGCGNTLIGGSVRRSGLSDAFIAEPSPEPVCRGRLSDALSALTAKMVLPAFEHLAATSTLRSFRPCAGGGRDHHGVVAARRSSCQRDAFVRRSGRGQPSRHTPSWRALWC
jgi:hypothetical protein